MAEMNMDKCTPARSRNAHSRLKHEPGALFRPIPECFDRAKWRGLQVELERFRRCDVEKLSDAVVTAAHGLGALGDESCSSQFVDRAFQLPFDALTWFGELRKSVKLPLESWWSARRFLCQLRCDKLEQKELLDGTRKEAYGGADCELAAAG
jgi:hypothetical protein